MTDTGIDHRVSGIDPYLAERIRQPYPRDSHVLPGSTPVVSFGDVRSAWVATLGINPSDSEFVERGKWLDGDRRRFETLASLGLGRHEDADDEHVARIIDACYGYFTGPNPYWTWFRPLEKLLGDAVGASYVDGSAAHLDLIQWATAPVWGRIPDQSVRRRLIEADREFLRRQLAHEGIRLVLMNGRRVMDEVARMGVTLTPVDLPPTDGRRFEIQQGTLDGTLFLGWNLAYPNGGISTERTTVLIDVVRRLGTAMEPTRRPQNGQPAGAIDRGTTVTSKPELVERLTAWLATGEKTLGDVGSFGGKPWIRIDLSGAVVVLNADTKRAAVGEYLDHVRQHGADTPWLIVPNARGTVNKVVFRADGAPTEGWYAYTARAQPLGTTV